MHGIGVTVISFVTGGRRRPHRLGHRQRHHRRPRSTALVEAADAAARAGSPAEDAADLVTGDAAADWDDAPGPDRHPRLRQVRAGPGRGVRAGRATASRVLYGFVNHELTTTYLGSSTGLRLRHVAADRPLRLHRQDRRPDPERLGRRRDPRLHRRRRPGDGRDAGPAARLGRAAGRPAGRPLRHDPAAHRGRRPDDRRLLVRRRPDRPRGPVGLQQARRRHPDRRPDRPRGRQPLLRPGLPRPRVRAVRDRRDVRQQRVGLRQRPAARPHRLDPRRHAHLAAADPALRRDDRPAGHADDRQPGARGRRRVGGPSTTWWPAPSAGCC